MSRVESHQVVFDKALRRRVVQAFDVAGSRSVGRSSAATPVGEGKHGGPGGSRGHAREAHGYAVIGEGGGLEAGMTATANGHAIPIAFLAVPNGITLALVNMAPYWLWIEIGASARGRAGRFILTREVPQVERDIRADLEASKRG